jgi:hypothetical protein
MTTMRVSSVEAEIERGGFYAGNRLCGKKNPGCPSMVETDGPRRTLFRAAASTPHS